MRSIIFFFGIVALLPNLSAALQTIRLTPALLTKWTVTGPNLDPSDNSSQITLPATVQLAHTYKSSVLGVSFTTQPVLGENSDTWPVFVIGSAALVFSRDNAGGHLVLAVGDASPVELSGSFDLDADGRSSEPLVIEMSKVRASLKIYARGKTFEFPLENDTGTELVISAGIAAPWTLKNLDITADGEVFSADVTAGNSSGISKKSTNAGGEVAGRKSLVDGTGKETTSDTSGGESNEKQNTLAASNVLEIFTPPGVRRGRAENVRAAVVEIQRK